MTISPEYAEELGRQIDELEAENERLREFSAWVDTWVSNPVTSYSVCALDGLFGMTRDKLATLAAQPPAALVEVKQATSEPPITDLMYLKQQSERLSVEDQHALAEFIAPNLGMVLVNEPPHPDCPHERSSAATEAVAWQCTDDRYPYIEGIVTDRQRTVEVWREGDIKFVGLGPITAVEPQSSSMRTALEDISNWLEGCLQCKTWSWDGLQRDAAEAALKEARAALRRVELVSLSVTQAAPSKLLELADRIDTNKRSWLPISGHVVNVTFDLDEADAISAALRAFAAQRSSAGAGGLTPGLMNATTVSCTGLEITIACNDHDTKDALMGVLVDAAPPTQAEKATADDLRAVYDAFRASDPDAKWMSPTACMIRATLNRYDVVSKGAAQPLAAPLETAKHSPDKCGRDCQYYDYFEMLRNWFADEIRRGAEDMRANAANGGLSADDFKQMLDDHETNLIQVPPQDAPGSA